MCIGLKFAERGIERVHVFALKRYFVASQTRRYMVKALSLVCHYAIKAVKYWLRVVTMSPERHTKKACNM